MQPMSPRTATTKAEVTAPAKRTYNSSRRKRQAQETRAEVLAAAVDRFNETGWAGTTVADIAEAAGVAVETVYAGFGSKKALLRDAADVAVAGDAEPLTYIERPEFAAMGEGPVAERVRVGMDVVADSNQRTYGIWRALGDAAQSDEELRAWVLDAERRRRLDTGRSLERIFEHPVAEPMLDAICLLYSQDSYRRLVVEEGYSRAAYQRMMAEATVRLLDEDPALIEHFG
jgi:AcrR family transcriptional regulator